MKPWLVKLYQVLVENYEQRPFSFPPAVDLLQKKEKVDANQVRVAFTEFRRYGLITTKPDPNDARKRIYTLNPRKVRFVDISSQVLGSPENIAPLIFKAAELLRKGGGDRFLPLMFSYRVASETGELDDMGARRKGAGTGAARETTNFDFAIPPGCRWEDLLKDPSRAVGNLIRGLKAAAKRHRVIGEAFPVADFLQYAGKQENANSIKQFIELTGGVPLHQIEPTELSDTYEAILGLSVLKKGQAGVYTVPREPVQLLTELLDPQAGNSVYDPSLGLGTTLILCHHHVREKYGEDHRGRLFYYGQEMDSKMLALARQNLFFNGVTDAQLFPGNPLLHPIQDGGKLKTFQIVVCCPQWGGEGYPEGTIQKTKYWRERFRYGLPSRKTLDGAWLQIALASTSDEGRAGVLLNSGFLSRGGRDVALREGIVADDRLEAVILLPQKVVSFATVPGSILVLNKRKHPLRKGKVLFINSGMESGRPLEVSRQSRLGDEECQRIVEVFRDFKEETGFSRIVSGDEIRANGFTLIPPVYINPTEKAGRNNVLQAWKSLRDGERALKESHAQLEKILRDLSLLKVGKGGKR